MWYGYYGVVRRTALTTLPTTNLQKQVSFPSWSWMGWKGESSPKLGRERQESERSTVVCHVHHSEPLCFKHISQLDDDRYRSELFADDTIEAQEVTSEHSQTHLPLLTADRLSTFPDEHLHFFWTTTAMFTVEYKETIAATFQEYADWEWPPAQDESGKIVGKMNRLASATAQGNRMAEFIELGRRGDPDVPPEILPQMVLVLEISRNELGIAERINYEEVEIKAWQSAGSKACLVALA